MILLNEKTIIPSSLNKAPNILKQKRIRINITTTKHLFINHLTIFTHSHN